MVLPPGNTLRSSLLALPWLPTFGLLLAVSGTLVFLVGLTEPPLTLDPPRGMARLEAGQDPARATAGLVRITAVDQTATDHRSRPVTTQNRILRGDPRGALMVMAAGHDVRSGRRSCPFLMMGLACPGRGQANSDDRIADALFAPDLTQSVASSSGEEQGSHSPRSRGCTLGPYRDGRRSGW